MTFYPYIKALHVIFVISWFAALFYLPRLMVYHREACDNSEPDRSIIQAQLLIMMRRLWNGISVPAAILVLITGITMLLLRRDNLPDWLYIKIILLILLYTFHFFLQNLLIKIQIVHSYSSYTYRVINEIPTLLLFGIIFLAITKEPQSWLFAFGSLFLILVIFFSIRRWKAQRK